MQKAIDWLRKEGFNDNQIYTEFSIQIGYRPRRIDVVGISPQRKIAIECGTCSTSQLELIRPYFDDILHFPYPDGRATRYYKRPR
jgi:hypothetical protein